MFRLFIVGIVITLIIYPIAIMVLSIFTFLLVLITYLFNVTVFHFETSTVRYGFFVGLAPMPSLIIKFVFMLVRMTAYTLYLTIIAPIAAFFILLWTLITRGFRTLTDTVMLFLISKLGRTPSRDTAIAKKISGPGMSKGYYMSINE